MAIFKGTYFSQEFTIVDGSGAPIDISAWQFEADFRDRLEGEELLNITTASGGFAVIDGANGRLQMALTPVQTDSLPIGRLVFDVLRTDDANGDIWLFGGKVTVKQPVTRDD